MSAIAFRSCGGRKRVTLSVTPLIDVLFPTMPLANMASKAKALSKPPIPLSQASAMNETE